MVMKKRLVEIVTRLRGLTSVRRSSSGSFSQDNILSSPYPRVELPSVPLHSYIWHHIDRWPNHTAIECGLTGRSYSYRELRTRCHNLAWSLSQLGLAKGDCLSVVMPNVPEYPIALLGPLELGLTVNTVNPLYTADEMVFQLKHVDTKCVICHPTVVDTVLKAVERVGWDIKVVCSQGLDGADRLGPAGVLRLSELTGRPAGSELSKDIDPRETAVIAYSSGTTGLPKGTCLTHNSLSVNLEQARVDPCCCIFPTEGQDQCIIPSVLPFFHCYGLAVLLMYGLRQGAKIVTLPKFEPKTYINVLKQYKKNVVLFTVPPTVFFLGTNPEVKRDHLSGLERMITAAAPCSPADIEKVQQKYSGPILQVYGMTEASPILTHPVKDCMDCAHIGPVVSSTLAKVLDVQTGEALPPLSNGELCFKGPQIMKGYLKNPESTAATIDSDGWIHTGDIGYYNEEGLFYITDRLKELIKVKGFQVAPAELEEVLRRHPSVLEAGVVGVPCPRAGETPVAFVSLRPGQPRPSPELLLGFVSDKLAPYKRISKISFIEEIPKTASGKIMRKVLKGLTEN